jgi:hypothetical protein
MVTPLIISIVLALAAVFLLFHRRSRSALFYRLFTARHRSVPLYKDVKFTVVWPRFVASGHWHKMLAFAHQSFPIKDSNGRRIDPEAQVRKQVEEFFGNGPDYGSRRDEESQFAVPHEGHLTFVPSVKGVTFDPPAGPFLWQPPVRRQPFRFKPNSDSEGSTLKGSMKVYLGWVLLAEVALTIKVNTAEARKQDRVPSDVATAKPYDKIFVAYAHKDRAIVYHALKVGRIKGDTYLRDSVILNAGEKWVPRLEELIAEADIFQLFWSQHANDSKFVESEWQYALRLDKGEKFIRPTYWEKEIAPDGNPPRQLEGIHFEPLRLTHKELQSIVESHEELERVIEKGFEEARNERDIEKRFHRSLTFFGLLLLLTSGVFAFNALKGPLYDLFNRMFGGERPVVSTRQEQRAATPGSGAIPAEPQPPPVANYPATSTERVGTAPSQRKRREPSTALSPPLPFPDDGAVHGRLTGPDGSPIQGAVLISHYGEETTTDQDGRYRLRVDLEDGLRITVRLHDPSTGRVISTSEVPASLWGELDLTADESGMVRAHYFKPPLINLHPLHVQPPLREGKRGGIHRYDFELLEEGTAASEKTFKVEVPKELELVRALVVGRKLYDPKSMEMVEGGVLEKLKPSLIRSHKSGRVYLLVERVHPGGVGKQNRRTLRIETRLKRSLQGTEDIKVKSWLVSYKDEKGRVYRGKTQ